MFLVSWYINHWQYASYLIYNDDLAIDNDKNYNDHDAAAMLLLVSFQPTPPTLFLREKMGGQLSKTKKKNAMATASW